MWKVPLDRMRVAVAIRLVANNEDLRNVALLCGMSASMNHSLAINPYNDIS